MSTLKTEFIKELFNSNREDTLFGKWITLKDIQPLIKKLGNNFSIDKIGESEENRSIYSLKIGSGDRKILFWSQMHGNESTGTKALFDLFNCFTKSNSKEIDFILKSCTLLFIPMLNPDGALAYTRVNANDIDLNRDAVDRKAKESKLLRSVLDNFNPHFCFNLHDQRTIFGVEGYQNPATVSFLAPSEEETRALTKGRKETMNVIVSMNNILQQIIPNYIGRYTDEYYPTATGDNFQKLGYNTILIESGHYPNDYDREKSREFTFYAIFQGLYHIAFTTDFSEYEAYFTIPNNVKSFYDVIHRHKDPKMDEAFLYKDEIIEGKMVSRLEKITDENLFYNKFGHTEIVFETK